MAAALCLALGLPIRTSLAAFVTPRRPQQGCRGGRGVGALAPTATPSAGVASAQADQVLRKRIGWLNANAGLRQEISYNPIAEAARGVDLGLVLEVLKDLEDNNFETSDPTSWILDTLQPLGGARRGSAASAKPPKKRRTSERDLRREIGWLNNQIFQKRQISVKQVSEALSRFDLDLATVIPIVKAFKTKAATAKDDPTAHLIAALYAQQQRLTARKQKEHMGAKSFEDAGRDGDLVPSMDVATDREGELDDEVAQKIRWLNTQGGFDGKINSLVVADAVSAAERSVSFTVEILDQLEKKKKEIEDEILKASSAILNSLLTLLNERTFDNGQEKQPSPLETCIAASNELPESGELAALFERFLFRLANNLGSTWLTFGSTEIGFSQGPAATGRARVDHRKLLRCW